MEIKDIASVFGRKNGRNNTSKGANITAPLDYFEGGFNKHIGLSQTLEDLGLSEDELQTKKILLVGPGVWRYLAREAKEKGFDAEFIDPIYRLRHGVMDPEIKDPETGWGVAKDPRAIAGVAEMLPFSNESFDFVLAHASIPEYSTSTGNALKALSEMIRVLKPQGNLRAYPFIIDSQIATNVRAGLTIRSYEEPFKRFDEGKNKPIETLLNHEERDFLRRLKKQRNISYSVTRLKGHDLPLLIVTKTN